MKTCLTEDCDNITEGSTDFCASCNNRNRRTAKARVNERLKFQAKISAPKKIYAKPNKISPKRKVLNAEYSILREKFLIDHPDCEIKLLGCDGASVDVHHKASGTNKVANLNNTKTWLASCSSCHRQLHDKLSAKEARDKNLKI
jgi:hypothetical protein